MCVWWLLKQTIALPAYLHIFVLFSLSPGRLLFKEPGVTDRFAGGHARRGLWPVVRARTTNTNHQQSGLCRGDLFTMPSDDVCGSEVQVNQFRKILISSFVAALVATGCNEGALEIHHGDGFDPDVGVPDDTNGVDPPDDTGTPSEDTGGVDDTGTGEDTGTDEDTGDNGGDPPPPPCDIGDFECQGDSNYRVCVDDGAGSAQWDDESCSGGQLCAHAANDLGEICQTCPESDLAPNKHTSPNAPTLSAGDSFSNLRLCEEPNGQNFFYLGQTDSFTVNLEWEDHADALRIDSWVADSSGVDWDGRDWYSLGSHGSYDGEISESLSSTRHVYVRVYYSNGGPSSGVPYSISRSN